MRFNIIRGQALGGVDIIQGKLQGSLIVKHTQVGTGRMLLRGEHLADVDTGLDRLGEMVEKNCEQAAWLAARIKESESFHLAAPASLNIVCFQTEVPGDGRIDSDELNREIVTRVQERGIAVPSTAEIDGRLCIRVAITNHRTRREDLEIFLDAIEEIRREIADES